MMDDSNADKALLQVATAQGLDELSTAIRQSALSPVALLSAVPETTSASDLASILRQTADTETAEILSTEQWAASCVARAESIDQCTGRLDWALAWLETALELTTGARQGIERALANARILDATIALGGDSSRELRDVNAMSDLELVQWTVDMVEADPAMMEVLDILCTEANVRSAWNEWWANRVDVGEAVFMHRVVGRYAELFEHHTLLAAVYAIGGGCSDLEGAQTVLSFLAKTLGVDVASQSVRFAADTLAWLEEGNAQVLVAKLQDLTEDQVRKVVGAGLAQVRVLNLLTEFGFETDIPAIVACQDRVEDQRRVLIRLLATAQRSATTKSVSLWETLLSLHSLELFGCLTVDDLKQEYLRSLLSNEEFDQARDLINATPAFIDEVVVRDIVCQCVCELFDNAESGNMDQGLMKAARLCLDVLPAQWQDDQLVQRERQLIDAAHLTWTLQQSGSSIFTRGRSTGSNVLPIEIRLATDPYELIKCVLDRQSQGYKKPRIVKEIASKLRGVNESKGLRNVGVGSVADAFVTALLLDAAVVQADYPAAYEFARQLANARTVLDKALKVVDAYRSAQLLQEVKAGIERPVEVRAVEQAWTACVRLAQAWGDSQGVAEKQLEVVSFALSLCPTGKIPELLKLWNEVQSSVLDSQTESSLPWVAAAPADSSILDVMVGRQLEAANDQSRSVASEVVDIETMRTFDPAIIKSSLRQAPDSETRCRMLMEWLDFAMTTAKEPKTDKAAAYKARIELEIVQKYAAQACELLSDKVVPELDQTNYFALETFYAFLGKCLESNGDSVGAKQAGMRAELARGIRAVEALDLVEFSGLVASVTGSRIELGEALNVHSVVGIAGLVPLFVQLRYLPSVDAESQADAAAWDAGDMTSLLYSRVLNGILDQISRSSNASLLTAQFVALLADYLPRMQSKDVSGLVDRLAFERSVANRIDIASRLEAVHLCAERAGSEATMLGTSLVEFIGALSEIRDPFTFSRLANSWVDRFDALEINKGDAKMLGSKCVDTLVGMITQHVPAYFVCQAYLLVVAVVGKWSSDAAVPGLADIYVGALDNAVDLAGQLTGDRVLSIAEPPLELCTFDYGDDSLGKVLRQFKQEFGAQLADTIHGRRSGEALSSSTKLVLLDIYRKHYPESPRASMLSIDRSAAAGRKSVDISDADLLQFQLLADKFWARSLTDDQGRTLDERCAIWKQLLEQSTTDEQIDTLVGLLARWYAGDTDSLSIAGCAVQLVEWAVRNKTPQRVVVAILANSVCFTSAVGETAFEELLEETQRDPMMAGSLALMALAYPDQAWAERCLESVIYVMMMAPASESEIADAESPEELDDEDPWGIDDVDIGETEEEAEQEETGPSQAELFAARTSILSNAALHIAIMIRGFVPASLASPALFDALEATLMYGRSMVTSDPACQALLSALIQTSHLQGTAPIDELFRRTVHTMGAVGMEDRALLWVYEYFGVPSVQRFAARAGTVKRWLGHLDRVLLGETYERRSEEEVQVPNVSEGAGDVLVEDDEDDEDAGWGESDVDLDDEEIDVLPTGAKETVVEPDAKKLTKEPAAAAVAVPTVKTVKAEDDDDDEEEGGWGDDGSDIDLDADLERL